MRAITISRTKAVVKLPSRVDEIHHLNFSTAEREKYDAAKTQSRVLLEEAISSGNQGSRTFNALWLLNILRLICNHGLLAQSGLESKRLQAQRSLGGWSPGEASESFYGNILGGGASCSTCGANLLGNILEESTAIETQRPMITSGTMVCEACIAQTGEYSIPRPWDNGDVQKSNDSPAPGTPLSDYDVAYKVEFMSTKIKALVIDLAKHNTTAKRSWKMSFAIFVQIANFLSVVFSYWTNTLDFVQLMLNHADSSHTRIDGKASLPRRNEALRAFQNDDSVRVILVSITCGGAE